MKDSTTKVLQAFILLCVAIVGFFLNVIVTLVFYRRPALRSSSNRFVLSLVVANFVSVLALVPAVLYLYSKNSLDCLTYHGSFLAILVVTASVFSILTVAIDRYNAVLSPLHYSMTITSQRNKETIFIIWFISILLSIPPVLGVLSKRIVFFNKEVVQYSYVTLLVVFVFIIPLFALIWVYARMYTAAHKNSERTRRQSVQANVADCSRGGSLDIPYPQIITTLDFIRTAKPPMLSQLHKRRCSNASFSAILFREEGKAVKTAVMVVASFLMCWCPFFIVLLFSSFELLNPFTHTTLFLGILPIVLNSVLSPFIYVFRNDIARTEAVKLLLWWKKISLYEENVLQQANKEQRLKTSNGAIRVRHQSSSNYDSMSVQSVHLPMNFSVECKQCSEFSPAPVADFVATYEVGKEKKDANSSEKIQTSEAKTKGESVTFRLAFLPQRRCQTCFRQNSDSSSGSAHPLLRESDSPPPPPSTPHFIKLPARINLDSEIQKKRLKICDSPKHPNLSDDKNQTIIETEEQQPSAETSLSLKDFNAKPSKINSWTSNENIIETKKREPSRQDSDVTVDSGVDMGLDRSHSSNNSLTTMSPVISLSKRQRHKLQRLSAVEDENGLIKSKISPKFPPYVFG